MSEFVLRFRLGEGEWQVYPLTSPEILVGRDADNDLILEHQEISRHHLQIRFEEDEFSVMDLGSSNGTELDGIPLTPQMPSVLRPGQMIIMGDFTLVLVKASEGSTHISKELLPFLLRYRFGSGTWQTFPMEPGIMTLGRDPDCDFYLNDSEVSRQHARLQINDDEIWLIDLASTNGTQVGGISLAPNQPYKLQLGQPFSIGNFVLQVDEPSRYYKAPSAVIGKANQPESPSLDVSTLSAAELASAALMPVHAMNLMSRKRTVIGRAPDNDLVINHPLVNHHHAVIEPLETGFRIRDLDSTYGVFVNDQRIRREADLKDWDQIRIGNAVFVLSGNDLQQQVIHGLKLEIKNVHQRVSRSLDLLQDISLMIKPNEFVALVGPRDSGKTALLKVFSGFKPASHGQVLVNDIDLYQHYEMFRNDIGYVPAETIVHSQLTPVGALDFAARLRLPPETTKEERTALVDRILGDLNLTAQRERLNATLTRSQNKRVSLGCELLIKPRLLFLDDPIRGLEPGAEYEMVKLLRRLADHGRTILTVIPATKNLLLFDKVIFLVRGGFLAFFGAPEEALDYFNQFRTDREIRQKEMGFDDIQRILEDEERGAPAEWSERFLKSPTYFRVFGIDSSLAELQTPDVVPPVLKARPIQAVDRPISGFRQFRVLVSRNLKILPRDKTSLFLMLGLAPILGLLDFVWGRNLSDPVHGDAGKIIIMWFMGALSAIFGGLLSGFSEIVKEFDIYKHERAVNLRISPYIFSKLWLGIPLALYQAGVLLAFRRVLVNLIMPSQSAYLPMYFTLFLIVLAGYLLGLLISAAAPNRDKALLLVLVVLIFQLLFAGALLPLDWIPGAKHASFLMPARWSYEALVRTTGLGDKIITDPCWTLYSLVDRLVLSDELKEGCPCLGVSIFSECADFPGILSGKFYFESSGVESSEKAIRNAEAVISSVYDDHPQIFRGTVTERWVALLFIQLILVVLLILVQKRKDKIG